MDLMRFDFGRPNALRIVFSHYYARTTRIHRLTLYTMGMDCHQWAWR